MPGILKYTPPWLSRPSTGYDLFVPTHDSKPSSEDHERPGPLRTIAHRGSEIFIAVGKELRWSDLVLLKETWEEQNDGDDDFETSAERTYRVNCG